MDTTWRELLIEKMKENKDKIENIVSIAPENLDLDKPFYSGFGREEGEPFCVWTKKYVYFPLCYDGSEWVGCASRSPNGKPLGHQGG